MNIFSNKTVLGAVIGVVLAFALIFGGWIGFFFTLVFLFVRFLPALAVAEMKELAHVVNDPGHHHPETKAPGADYEP